MAPVILLISLILSGRVQSTNRVPVTTSERLERWQTLYPASTINYPPGWTCLNIGFGCPSVSVPSLGTVNILTSSSGNPNVLYASAFTLSGNWFVTVTAQGRGTANTDHGTIVIANIATLDGYRVLYEAGGATYFCLSRITGGVSDLEMGGMAGPGTACPDYGSTGPDCPTDSTFNFTWTNADGWQDLQADVRKPDNTLCGIYRIRSFDTTYHSLSKNFLMVDGNENGKWEVFRTIDLKTPFGRYSAPSRSPVTRLPVP